MGQVADRTQKPEKEETKKKGYWGNTDSEEPPNILGEQSAGVHSRMECILRKDLRCPQASPLVTLWVPHRQKVKAKAGLWLSTESVLTHSQATKTENTFFFSFWLQA